ncbi:phosphoribosyltransferase-like protein [Chryseobacterium aureum]|uniref:phosphoribosyltransferase-like protein n=1 Tax=Chryseobacterium aureum TaxID=2497456 RepID=UPI000F877B01|nr:hypothetical protein [Chryseobacterium aureum]
MKELAESIHEIIKDYRNHDGIFLTQENIIEWAEQFGDQAELVLGELNKIMPEVYLSREKAKSYLEKHIKFYMTFYGYSNITNFLMDTEFVDLQEAHKSQPAILKIIEEILNEQYDESYIKYLTYPKVNYIYFDDVLASGSTIGKQTRIFLEREDSEKKKFYKKIEDNEIRYSICIFCLHRWGYEFMKYGLTNKYDAKSINKIKLRFDYEVQNHSKFNNQKFNVAKPLKGNNVIINTYLEGLAATKHGDHAYREINSPKIEQFFTSPANRTAYETTITEKGIEILNMIQSEVKPNLRPLGMIGPDYKIFGLGTHFFTWRNIPNNCPLVFWWHVTGHKWKPLFELANRGLTKKD